MRGKPAPRAADLNVTSAASATPARRPSAVPDTAPDAAPDASRPARGACQEYSDASNTTLPLVGDANPFVAVPSSAFCQGPSYYYTFWLDCVNVLVFLVFLARLRRLQRTAARAQDRALWTAADYAILVAHLDAGKPAEGDDGQLEAVYADLAALGAIVVPRPEIESRFKGVSEANLKKHMDTDLELYFMKGEAAKNTEFREAGERAIPSLQTAVAELAAGELI